MIAMRVYKNRVLAAYWMRQRRKPRRRSLLSRLRKVMYPNARKAGPVYPSIRPSRPDLPKFGWR